MSPRVSDSPSAPSSPSPLDQLWLCEAIRLRDLLGKVRALVTL